MVKKTAAKKPKKPISELRWPNDISLREALERMEEANQTTRANPSTLYVNSPSTLYVNSPVRYTKTDVAKYGKSFFETIKCPKCSTNNCTLDRHCIGCGTELGTYVECDNCDYVNIATSIECGRCGCSLQVAEEKLEFITDRNPEASYETHIQIRWRCLKCHKEGIAWARKDQRFETCPECGEKIKEMAVIPPEGRASSIWDQERARPATLKTGSKTGSFRYSPKPSKPSFR